ncbi:response regulator, partial [Candidatus Fermentibacteria bacterium]|nr:response regulator [Candidatus Fermentibacteria bacterium]
MEKKDPFRPNLEEIREAARRSTDLTRQLLAFARKQIVQPRVIDLNDLIDGMLKMLRRLIGEDVRLSWKPKAGLWSVRMDPSQVDQILANLCVNARDAIGGVGEVIIATENVFLDAEYCASHAGRKPGPYVMLAVSDDGCGIRKEMMEHLFEPFFTTKGVGEGTGLGLSTVHGIVTQNNGFIEVYSEVGSGTTFRIYLPRHRSENEEAWEVADAALPQRGGETVLLVEDDPAILPMGAEMLQGLGYQVVCAGTPGEALHKAEEHGGEIDLLITDVVMPEMNGRELAGRIAAINPGLRCLYMSGYTADAIAHHGVLDEGVHFVQKPFTLAQLSARVREALEG